MVAEGVLGLTTTAGGGSEREWQAEATQEQGAEQRGGQGQLVASGASSEDPGCEGARLRVQQHS